jgi:DNA repair protein RecO (recombination protein O)
MVQSRFIAPKPMRLSHNTPAIILRARPYGESDKIVSFLTANHGKITGIAKGAKRSRKRFVNSLEPFSLVQLCFQDRPHSNLVFILASDLLLGFKNLVSSLEKIAVASYLVEITDGLIGERDENPLVFHHLKNGLNFLENNRGSLIFLTAFELKLLRLAGYQPSLNRCKQCARELDGRLSGRWHFSPTDGAIFCQSCSQLGREILPVGSAALAALVNLQEESNGFSLNVSPPYTVLKEIRSVVLRFIQFHMDRDINSASFLYQFCAI